MYTSEENLNAPPTFKEMFIISTDTLRGRKIDQALPETWNDHPPLFKIQQQKLPRRIWQRLPQNDEEGHEDENLLKEVRSQRGVFF